MTDPAYETPRNTATDAASSPHNEFSDEQARRLRSLTREEIDARLVEMADDCQYQAEVAELMHQFEPRAEPVQRSW